MSKIPYILQVCWLAISYLFRKTYTANFCKHRTKKTGLVRSNDERYIMSMSLSGNGNPDYCLDCIAKMAIKCAWCNKSIRIGDPVTLYIPQESYKVPEHAIRHEEDDELYLVGCLDWDCARIIADRAGFWMPPGKVKRVPSPVEMLISQKDENRVIIIEDLSRQDD